MAMKTCVYDRQNPESKAEEKIMGGDVTLKGDQKEKTRNTDENKKRRRVFEIDKNLESEAKEKIREGNVTLKNKGRRRDFKRRPDGKNEEDRRREEAKTCA